jgi:hypothetical protein
MPPLRQRKPVAKSNFLSVGARTVKKKIPISRKEKNRNKEKRKT